MSQLTRDEFKVLYRLTPCNNKLTSLERSDLTGLMKEGKPAYIYYGGKYLNVKSIPPNFNKTRFIVKPIVEGQKK